MDILGHKDCPLSSTGRQQAELLGKRLSNSRFTHFFSSDLKRARQVRSLSLVDVSKTVTIYILRSLST